MAHFAQLDDNNKVIQVIVVDNQDTLNEAGEEAEAVGISFCQNLLGGENWKQTSYNSTFRKNYAGIGYVYDAVRDAFIPPQPYPSWDLDEETCQWTSPIPYPSDGVPHNWNEATREWIPSELYQG